MADRSYFPLKDLRELMDIDFVNKNKINCIKHIRSMTGEGLKEAKDFFEQEWLPFINGERKSYAPPRPDTDIDHIMNRIQNLENQVNALRAAQTKERAKGIFNDDEQA